MNVSLRNLTGLARGWLGNLSLVIVLTCAAVTPAGAASLEQMAGQMIMVGFQGTSTTDADVRKLGALLAEGHIGGVMYLRNNVTSLAAVRQMNADFMSASEVPPLIALDQEGGYIERLTSQVGFAEIPSAQKVAEGLSPAKAEVLYAGMARNLAALGFNTNFGPVVDLNINPANPIIAKYERSYGADAGWVAAFGEAFVAGHRAAKVLTALKHFPGHGSSTTDSHQGFVDVTRTWQAKELDPYRALIDAGMVDMVMVGHLYHAKFVGEGDGQIPSSLSPNWITGVLRAQLGFDGVVVSDDMQMSAIRAHFGFENAIVRAVNAGMDMLLFSNTAEYHIGLADEILAVLMKHADADPAFAARIEQSYRRIVALKNRLN